MKLGANQNFDFATIVSTASPHEPVMCEAHSQGQRLLLLHRVTMSNLNANTTDLITNLLESTRRSYLDGIHLEVDQEILDSPVFSHVFFQFVQQVGSAIGKLYAKTTFILVVTVPWSPFEIHVQLSQFQNIFSVVDFILIDTRTTVNQLLDRCIATPSSEIRKVKEGVSHYLNLGVPAHKLIPLFFWEGVDFQCSNMDITGPCVLSHDQDNSTSCIGAITHLTRSSVQAIMSVNARQSQIDSDTSSSFISYITDDQKPHQVWFDGIANWNNKINQAESWSIGGSAMSSTLCDYLGMFDATN